MKDWQIWVEGVLCTGTEGVPQKALLLGTERAETFAEACQQWADKPDNDKRGDFNSERLTFWGCGLYDNEADARKLYG